jgi:hypothetical protein
MSKFKDMLEEFSENERKIEAVAHPLYEKRNELVRKLIPLFLKRNPEVVEDGLIKSPISVKFKDGKIFRLQPNYMSATGHFKGAVFKAYGVELFTITEKGAKKGK